MLLSEKELMAVWTDGNINGLLKYSANLVCFVVAVLFDLNINVSEKLEIEKIKK